MEIRSDEWMLKELKKYKTSGEDAKRGKKESTRRPEKFKVL